MATTASKILKLAKSWIGKKESDGSFKDIIDTYNKHKPLARGYKMKYTDEWCATTISSLAIKCGATDIIPTECSCQRMIEKFMEIGCWRENENIVPEPGWVLFFDWGDNGKGDNKGWSDHVGIVEKVSNGKITVIEGNNSSSVKRRTLAVNGKYIRGYGVPKYQSESFKVKVIAWSLTIRSGAGVTNKAVGYAHRGEIYTITEVDGNWGKCDEGWMNISGSYCDRIDK